MFLDVLKAGADKEKSKLGTEKLSARFNLGAKWLVLLTLSQLYPGSSFTVCTQK